MEISKIIHLGPLDPPNEDSWSHPSLYAVRVVGDGGYQAEFFVLAESSKEVKDRWIKHGRKMRAQIGEAIFDR
jgi:hypothetical protein